MNKRIMKIRKPNKKGTKAVSTAVQLKVSFSISFASSFCLPLKKVLTFLMESLAFLFFQIN